MGMLRGVAVVGMVVAVGLSVLAGPAAAGGRVGAPWVVAASPASVSLDWSGSGPFRVVATRQGSRRPVAVVRTRGSRATVTGLRPGTMHCFAVSRGDRSGTSRTYCHSTTRPVTAVPAATVEVATYNICGSLCGRLAERPPAMVQRLKEAGADVVAVQERANRNSLRRAIERAGLGLLGVTSGENAVLADVMRPGAPLKVADAHGGAMMSDVIHLSDTTFPWVTLTDSATGREFTIVSVHLASGSSLKASRKRVQQARAVIEGMRRSYARGPIIYAGDFNSSLARRGDPVGKVFARAGYVDAYQQSTSFRKAWVSSSNGFEKRPRRELRYGDHIDRIFVPPGVGVSDWRVVAPLRRGRNVTPMGSDHHPVRVTLRLP